MIEFGQDSVVTSRKEVIEELLFCRERSGAVGIWSSALGKGMFMCFVKEVVVDEDEDDVVVILNENDLNGSSLETHVLYAYEIEKVYRFRVIPDSSLKVGSMDEH